MKKGKKNKEAIVINLIGGPGCGKSIMAAKLFEKLKLKYISCDISMEYIKRKLREKALKVIESQIYIFGKQQFQLFTMKDEVEVIITDSPIILSAIYDKTNCPHLKALILKEFSVYKNLTYFIDRDEEVEYEQEGRYQDLKGAKEVDKKVKKFMNDHKIKYQIIKGIGNKSRDKIMGDILKELGKNGNKKK
ncbi:MAG TPA: AAA family ATPase [Candidatus Paceibacterota bacterium]|nr:AAA family ATPase [Candidatus Paceibacterota bacterium]